jgi:hypothetical protein
MQTNVATPSKPTIITTWDLQEGCYSNTHLEDEVLRIYAERKYYAVCGAALQHAMKCRKDTFRVGIRQNGIVRWIGFAWSGKNQSMDWLKAIAEHLVDDAWADFQEMEEIEVEIRWPEKFSKTREYRPSGMSAREMIAEAGIDWGFSTRRCPATG